MPQEGEKATNVKEPEREGVTAVEGRDNDISARDSAIDWDDGSKGWYRNRQLHREDGHAFEHADGTREWWLNGTQVTSEDIALLQRQRSIDAEVAKIENGIVQPIIPLRPLRFRQRL